MTDQDRTLCDDFVRIVWLLIDGDLSPADRALWDGHVSQCPVCRRELESARALLKEHRALPQQDAPVVLVERIVAAAQRPLRPRRAWTMFGRRAAGLSWMRTAFAAAVLIVGITLYVGLRGDGPQDLAWEPAELNASVGRIESALNDYREDGSDRRLREDRTDGQWDRDAEALRQQIAALVQEVERQKLPKTPSNGGI